jgi:prolyl-tRNA editing enzyme YbaK/EbsC (Cys-tRNA(Pro) deacylase)
MDDMLAATLGVEELRRFMQTHDIRGEIVRLEVPTPTVETAARAVGTSVDQIIKSILFLVDDHPVLAIACGLSNIQRRAIADFYGVGKKKVKLADPETVLRASGYEVGAMPPFGHRQRLNTVIDQRVLELPSAYAGGGAENVLLQLKPQDILQATGAAVLDLLA